MKEALKLALETLEESHPEAYCHVIIAIKEALAQPEPSPEWMTEEEQTAYTFGWFKALESQRIAQTEQEPVALKLGECWPENVMQMWDYYRKEIANGNTGSEPRDWFESLSEMRLVDTIPPQRTWVGLTDEEKQEWIDAMPYDPQPRHCMTLVNIIESKLKEKNNG